MPLKNTLLVAIVAYIAMAASSHAATPISTDGFNVGVANDPWGTTTTFTQGQWSISQTANGGGRVVVGNPIGYDGQPALPQEGTGQVQFSNGGNANYTAASITDTAGHTFNVGQEVTISFYLAGRAGGTAAATINVSLVGAETISLGSFTATQGDNTWVLTTSNTATITTAGTYNVQFSYGSAADGVDRTTYLDSVSYSVDGPPPTPNSGTWANTAGGTWGTAGNWLSNLVGSGSGNTANFNTLNITADTTVTLDSARTISNLVFGDTDPSSPAGWTLTGNDLTLAGTTPTITVNALGGTKTATISAVVAGSAGLAKSGPGTLTLTGTNTYSGATTISAGSLQIGDGGTTGSLSSSSAITNNANLTINRSDALTISNAITGSGTLTKTGSGTLTLEGDKAYSGGTTITGGTLKVGRSTLGTGAVVVHDGGTLHVNDQWVLCGANPYSVVERNIGTLTINAGGTLQLDAVQGFVNGAPNLILNGGLIIGGPNDFRGDLFLWNGNQQITAGGAATSTIASIIGVTGNNNTITVNADSTLNLTGGIKNSDWYNNGSSPGGFIKAGTGTLNLTGSSSYSGDTVITGGTLKLQGATFSNAPRAYAIATGAVLNLDGDMAFDTGTTTLSGTGTLRLTGGTLANGIGPGRNLNFAFGGDAIIDLQAGAAMTNGGWQCITWTNNQSRLNVDGTFDVWDGKPVFADALTGSGSVTISDPGWGQTWNIALTVGVVGGGGTFGGVLSDSAGSRLNLVKNGTGTQILTGTNTYRGTTTVNAGTLQIGDGSTTGTLGSGPVTIASGASLTINRSDDYSLSAGQTISGAGSLIKNGAGTLTLPSSATFTGSITLNAGTLKAGANQAFGASGTTFPLNGGSIHLNGYSQTLAAVTGNAASSVQGGTGLTSILTLGSGNTSSTFGGALSGNLALVKIGTGTLTLTGAVTMTGVITVQEGILDLSNATLSPGTRINTAKLATVKLPTASISKLYVDNVKLSPGRWGAPGSVAASLADFESPAFSGPGVVTVANTGISNMERWKSMKHGFFVHYVWDGTNGPMRPDGSKPTSINETADSFDAPGFADDMAAMSVEYVIFTAWQANFFPLYPSSAMNKYHSGRTPSRDMIGEMITAVRAKGIRVLLYTHPYQPIQYLGTYPNQYADLEWNDNLINDVYAELVDRYGDQIDGLFVDENFWQGNQDDYVDYDRLSDTIRRRNPELVLMHNWGAWSSCAMYTTDMTHRETPPGADLDANPWVSETTPVPSTQLVGPQWSATVAKVPTPSTTTAGRSAAGIFRTAVLGAGSCTSGGGWIWGAGPYSGDGKWPVGSQTSVGRWEQGVLEAMTGAAAYIAPVAASIKNTYPSTSWLTEPYTYIESLPQGIVATRSTDNTKEYIHVLNPPGTKTLNLPLPADGKVFSNAKLMKNNGAVTITRNTRGMSLTLGSSDNWETLDTVIVMDVASPGDRGLINNNDPAVTYSGVWTYSGNRTTTTEYGQDVHETATNGNYLEFAFNGTDIDLIGTCASNRGTADVFIDGVSQGSINLYSATDVFRRTVFSKTGLPRGPHTLKVVKTGGTLLSVDAFRVTELINSNDPSLSYTGTWTSEQWAAAIGGEVHQTNTNEDTVVLNFEGNGVDVIGSKGLGGGNVRYKLNSSFELAVPQSSNFEQAQALIYSSTNSQTLSHGLHTLTGWKRHGTWADVDAFRIYKGSSTPSLRWGTSGGGGTGTWNINNSTNWHDGSANVKWLDFGGTDYSAIFGGTAGTVTLASNINVNRLTFQTTGYTVRSNALNLTGPPAIITTPAGTTTINSAITGTASLVKAGPGTLKLNSAASTNTGNTTLNEGTLSLIGTGKLYSNLGWISKTVSVNNGAMLEVDRWDGNGCLGQLDYSVGNLVINGGTIRFTGNSNGTAEGQGFTIGALGATLQSDAPSGQRWNINLDVRFSNTNYGIASNSGGMLNLTGTGNGLISKVIPGNGGLTKSGAGTWTLTNTNTYTGDTTVNGGILSLGNGTAPTGLANTAHVIVAGGAKLNLNYSGTDAVNQLWLGGVRMPAGVYSSGNSSFITGNGTLTVSNVPATGSYTAWSGPFGHNLTGGPDGDDDSDGIENLLEYVLGGNPKAPSSGILPTATAASGNLVFTFRRIRSTTADTTQVFQYGTNLTGWTDVPLVAGGMVAIQPDTPTAGTDTVAITVPEGTEPRIFGRLKATVPPAPF